MYVQYLEASDKLFNWFDDSAVLDFINIFGTATTVVYLAWLSFILYKGLGDLKSFAAKQRVIYYFHLFACFVIMTSVVVTGTFGGSSGALAESGDLVYFHFLFNSYLIILAFLYAPVGAAAMESTDLEEGTPLFLKKTDANVVPSGFAMHKKVAQLGASAAVNSPLRVRSPMRSAVV